MSHELESMFYVAGRTEEERERNKPWHGLGTPVEEALTSAEALKIAGLDWEVNPKKMFLEGGIEVPGWVANVRSSDESVLGVVSNKYRICQNKEAFEFTDSLIGEEVKYETAGSLFNGKKVWMLAKMPKTTILGDDVEPYICFTNSHDGKGAIQVCMTPVRVVCNNTLNLALKDTKRSWTTRHMGDLQSKLSEAKYTLELAHKYLDDLGMQADKLANITINEDMIQKALNEIFQIKDGSSDRQKANVQKMKDAYQICYFAPDIAKFRGTAWGAINAMADMCTHTTPNRNTQTFAERNWAKTMEGHPLLDKMVSTLNLSI